MSRSEKRFRVRLSNNRIAQSKKELEDEESLIPPSEMTLQEYALEYPEEAFNQFSGDDVLSRSVEGEGQLFNHLTGGHFNFSILILSKTTPWIFDFNIPFL
uniref:Uncharacterized protein n=1 Tax=Cacopsylla melanoneura TaxID=428564 RepID=A0A8D8UNY7_9HEMI